MAQLALDVTAFAAHLRAALPVGFEVALDLALRDADAVAAGLDDALADADALLERIWASVETAVVNACADHARAVKGVNARYHLTGKPAPTEPSAYVADAAAPLEAFDARWAAALDPERARPWRSACTARAAEAYETLALDALDHAAKFEEVMAKRGNADSLRADSRKIALQLRLDLAAFDDATGCGAAALSKASAAAEGVLARGGEGG